MDKFTSVVMKQNKRVFMSFVPCGVAERNGHKCEGIF